MREAVCVPRCNTHHRRAFRLRKWLLFRSFPPVHLPLQAGAPKLTSLSLRILAFLLAPAEPWATCPRQGWRGLRGFSGPRVTSSQAPKDPFSLLPPPIHTGRTRDPAREGFCPAKEFLSVHSRLMVRVGVPIRPWLWRAALRVWRRWWRASPGADLGLQSSCTLCDLGRVSPFWASGYPL